MDVRSVRSDQAYRAMIAAPPEKRADLYRHELMAPFKEKWDLCDNLRFAAEDEAKEADEIYPAFAAQARKEGFDDIAALFDNVAGVENCHRMLFEDLYRQVSEGTLYKKPAPVKWKCADCGYEVTSAQAPSVCPLCQGAQGVFMLQLSDGN